MRGPLWEGLLKNHEPRLKPPYATSCFGELIGTLDSGQYCWEVSGDLRDLYYTEIHPKLCERLFAIFGAASISDWITLPVYMVGQRRTNPLPTIMICSEDESVRKKARKEIRDSAFLKEHARFKVMSVPTDPGMRNMEQLASDTSERKAMFAVKRAEKVLVDSRKPLQPCGMEIWVEHGSSLRPTTAFVAQIQGRTFLRTVHHAFVTTGSSISTSITTDNATIHIDSDPESESEFEDKDDHDVAITSIGSQSPDTLSNTGSDSQTSGKSTPDIDDIEDVDNHAVTIDIQEMTSRLAPLASSPATYLPKQIVQPPQNTLVSLGRLVLWSVDKDWALIEITNEELRLALERSTTEVAPPVKSLPGPKDNAEIVSYTSSAGVITGTFSGTPFCTRLPNSSSFQDVHRVRLNGALANGDCGSAVRNAATGELYGHIVAGCRNTGAALIMAAHQIEADFANLKLDGPFSPKQISRKVPSRLKFRLPQWVLEEITISQLGAKHHGQKGLHLNDSSDISFLKLRCSLPGTHRYVLKESELTVAMIPYDDSKWTVCVFTQEYKTVDDIDDSDTIDSVKNQPEENAIIASSGKELVDKDSTVNTRLYWLESVEEAIEKTTKNWRKILYHLDRSVKAKKIKLKLESIRSIDEFCEWNMKAMPIFDELSDCLSLVIDRIERFTTPGGDCDYFADDDRAVPILQCIRENLQTLCDLNGLLGQLIAWSEHKVQAITIKLEAENSLISLESSRMSSMAAATVLETVKVAMPQSYTFLESMISTSQRITSIVLVMAFFKVQGPIFGFLGYPQIFIRSVIIVYLVLRALNILPALARRYSQSKVLLALIAFCALEGLCNIEKENEMR